MKYLSLMRHAKSSWKNPYSKDLDRGLNKRGKRDAPIMVQRLLAQGLPDLVLLSPAKRVQRTLKLGCGEYHDLPSRIIDELYLISADGLIQYLINTPSSVNRLWVIGHNPGLTECHNRLAKVPIDTIPTCGYVQFALAIEQWSALANITQAVSEFDYPKRA